MTGKDPAPQPPTGWSAKAPKASFHQTQRLPELVDSRRLGLVTGTALVWVKASTWWEIDPKRPREETVRTIRPTTTAARAAGQEAGHARRHRRVGPRPRLGGEQAPAGQGEHGEGDDEDQPEEEARPDAVVELDVVVGQRALAEGEGQGGGGGHGGHGEHGEAAEAGAAGQIVAATAATRARKPPRE